MPRGGARPGAGRPRKAPLDTPKAQAAPDSPHQGQAEAADQDLSPLEFLLSVVRNPNEDKRLRVQCASIAAPYIHERKGEGGKKAAKDAAAKQVASRFSASAPPKLVAAGGKKV